MSRPMNKDELYELLSHIEKEHSPFARSEGKCVKYVDPHIDMRDGTIFSIVFRGFGWGKTLHTQNEFRDLLDSLFERCMKFLDEPIPSFECSKEVIIPFGRKG